MSDADHSESGETPPARSRASLQRAQRAPRGLPAELQITERPLRGAAVPDPLEALTQAANLYLRAPQTRDEAAAASTTAPAPTPIPDSLQVELAVEVWRLTRRIEQARTTWDERSQRGFDSSAKRLAAALSRAEVTWRDPVGAAYSDGMRSVRVLAFEPTDGLAPGERRIVETVRPTILIRGEVAAVGEVIVGVCKSDSGEVSDAADD